MKALLFEIFKKLNRIFAGKGMLRIGIFRPIFYLAYKHLSPKGHVVLEVNNYKMYVDPSDIGVSFRLMTHGSYEPFETVVFKSLLKNDMVVVDVGANIGYYTMLAASLVGKGGKVLAFEPQPYNFVLLKKNVDLNGFKNVTLFQKGLSKRLGKTKLFIDPKTKGSHSIYKMSYHKDSIEVNMTTLDKVFEKREHKIDIVKIDVEGAEPDVLEGMKNILKKNEKIKIFMELNLSTLKKSGTSPEEFLKKLERYNFKLYNMNEKEKKLERVGISEVIRFCEDNKTYTNLLCAKEELMM